MSLTSTKECAGIVHFIQATKIPGMHEKLVRMKFSLQHSVSCEAHKWFIYSIFIMYAINLITLSNPYRNKVCVVIWQSMKP